MRLLALCVAAFLLNGCAIAALPVAAQVPLWGGIAAAGTAGGMLAVTSVHDCKLDGGCSAVPLPP